MSLMRGPAPSRSRDPRIPQLPAEVIEQIMRLVSSGSAPGCHLDTRLARKAFANFSLVNKFWNSLALYAFFRKIRFTVGHFPPRFDARDPSSARWADPGLDRLEDQELFGALDRNLRDLRRSNFLVKLGQRQLDMIRVLTLEMSCTSSDAETNQAIAAHKGFARVIARMKNLEELTLNCHGQSRLDNQESGLYAYLQTWNRVASSPEYDQSGVLWKGLTKFILAGKSGSTQLYTDGAAQLLRLIERHRETLEILVIEDISIKQDYYAGPNAAGMSEVKRALKVWGLFKTKVLDLMGSKKLWVMACRDVKLTLVKDGPAPQGLLQNHNTNHFYDWPYETDIAVSSPSIDEDFTFMAAESACGCQPPNFNCPLD